MTRFRADVAAVLRAGAPAVEQPPEEEDDMADKIAFYAKGDRNATVIFCVADIGGMHCRAVTYPELLGAQGEGGKQKISVIPQAEFDKIKLG